MTHLKFNIKSMIKYSMMLIISKDIDNRIKFIKHILEVHDICEKEG